MYVILQIVYLILQCHDKMHANDTRRSVTVELVVLTVLLFLLQTASQVSRQQSPRIGDTLQHKLNLKQRTHIALLSGSETNRVCP